VSAEYGRVVTAEMARGGFVESDTPAGGQVPVARCRQHRALGHGRRPALAQLMGQLPGAVVHGQFGAEDAGY
jgi:hypothetical protein